jgi:hypothetical protein
MSLSQHSRSLSRRASRVANLLAGLAVAALPFGLFAGCAADPEGPAPESVSQAKQNLVTCTTIQRGTGSSVVEDVRLSQSQPTTNLDGQTLMVDAYTQSLIKFTLPQLPQSAVLNSATMTLYTTVAGGGPINIHAATSAWVENAVTFTSFNQKFASTISAVLQPTTSATVKSIDLTALTQAWIAGTTVNNGVILRTTASPATFIMSSEATVSGAGANNVPLRPALTLCYTTPNNNCAPNPCQNGATCQNLANGFTCACPPGFTGATCQTNIDDCSGSPCLNGGACTDGVNSYSCACPPGFIGANCQTNIDECAPAPCQNGGVCTDGVNSYSCACPAGFAGVDCAINVNDCASSPCVNGTCADGVNSYSCACDPGWSGQNCTVNIDDCAASSCANGVCVDGIASYTCSCAPGWTGTLCDVNIDDCASSPCLNGGACADGVSGYTCGCAPGYTGTNCEIDINDCLAQPCQNGGSCVDGVNSYTCQCPTGFTGANCQTTVVATCSTGFADCDGSSSNGCETNLNSSAASCGACGIACGAGLLCAQGSCQAPPATPTAGVPINFPEVHGALAPAVADIDADGILDVLVANAESGSAATPSGTLTVRRGVGDGTLQAEEYYPGAPLSSTAVVVADVNGDGWLDAITVNGQTNLSAVNGSISVYLNAGAAAPGTFGAPTTFTTGAPGSVHLCAADLDGDGIIDVATTSVSTNLVSVMLGNGSGGFGAPQLISITNTGGVQSTIGAADLNGDGRPDLAVTSPTGARLSVLINQGNGAFAAPVAYSNNKNGLTAGIAFGDFDGDGKLDIISNGASGAFLYFFKGNGNGTLVTGVGTATGASTVTNSALGVVGGDFNGDGLLDAYVLHAATNGGVYPFTGHGNGTFTLAPFISTGNSPGANALTLADLNHDGYLDLVLTNKVSATITVILNAL